MNVHTSDGDTGERSGEPAAQDIAHDTRGKHGMEAAFKQKIDGGMYVKVGDIVEGTVLERKGNRLFVDVGVLGVGVVFGREFYEAQHVIKALKPGDSVAAKVIEQESDIEKGYIELSLKEAGKEKLWADLKETMRAGTALTLKVKEVNRGGLLMEYMGIGGFMPVSQLSQKNYPRVENGDKEKIYEELKKFLGTEMRVKILDLDAAEGKLIFSERELDDAAVRTIIAAHAVGEELEGDVSAIAPFGVFIKFPDGLEGLIHVSELDWQLVQDPRDIVSLGEKVRVKIIGIEGSKVSLSLKALREDPWLKLESVVKKGDTVRGVVTKFNPFGAFVKLAFPVDGGEVREVQGLVHISEFGNEDSMRRALEIGKEHDFTVSMVDLKEHRISLALPKHAKKDDTKEEKGDNAVQ